MIRRPPRSPLFPYTTPSRSKELVRAAAAGDSAAISALYRRHFADVERRCRRITCCPHEAADAAQDALLATFRRLPSLDCRSEEHTSELQSRQYLVCRLLLEK